MTGYGKASSEVESKKITVEIRSLNSKQVDLSVKLPSAYRQQEYDIRNLISKAMQRGKIDVYINVESENTQSSASLNKELFGYYLKQLETATTEQNIKWTQDIASQAIASILRMPDVVATQTEQISEQVQQTLIATVKQALENIDEFRINEGTVLMNDLRSRVDKIEALRQQSAPLAADRCDMIKNRIREAVEAACTSVDNNRLEQEIVFYIEKLDVTEEQVRLKKHCEYFHTVAQEEQGVGRKLGFIAQEMGREINTLGSKANDAQIQRLVVEMKDELEKIKEQLLNIL